MMKKINKYVKKDYFLNRSSACRFFINIGMEIWKQKELMEKIAELEHQNQVLTNLLNKKGMLNKNVKKN
jgi:glutaminase